jgi:hypothetical protein
MGTTIHDEIAKRLDGRAGGAMPAKNAKARHAPLCLSPWEVSTYARREAAADDGHEHMTRPTGAAPALCCRLTA